VEDLKQSVFNYDGECYYTSHLSQELRISESELENAVVVPSDFESDHPLAGIEFTKKWEKKHLT